MRRLALAIALGLAVLAPSAASAASAPSSADQAGAIASLRLIASDYMLADRTHDSAAAIRMRTLADGVVARARQWGVANAARSADQLRRTLRATRVRLRPWPLPQRVAALTAATERSLGAAGIHAHTQADPYDQIRELLPESQTGAGEAYALFELGPGGRLEGSNPALADQTSAALWKAVAAAGPQRAKAASEAAERAVEMASASLGDTTVSRATVVADAGVIVFREGLEAVLILAAITASFTGARRRLRRPVLLGALAGLLATAITYVLAQQIVQALGDGGLRLQAITGLLAIAVLLLVTNWFFHRIYWSEWISRFNRRRKHLERIDRLGFISGQTAGFLLLGLTSVYREGFETVLFLQNLQVSAGTGATILGVAIGLGATLAVGTFTFALERKLHYRRMLIVTGVLIGVVLAIMTGTTIHTLQGLGWAPATPTSFDIPLAWSRWLGLYSTWEGIAGQVAAIVVVYGSYAAARGLQRRRRKRVLNGPSLAAPARSSTPGQSSESRA